MKDFTEKNNNLPLVGRQLRCVVIGGSAGALRVLQHVLSALAPSFPLPIIIVVHFSSNLYEGIYGFLKTKSVLPVREPFDKEPIQNGIVYIAPSNYHLLIEKDYCFSLSVDQPVCYARPSIDMLFNSASDVYGCTLLGILLSGYNRDGTLGLRQIYLQGGVTMVQDPKTAMATVMIDSALRSMPVDYVMSPEEIGDFLKGFGTR